MQFDIHRPQDWACLSLTDLAALAALLAHECLPGLCFGFSGGLGAGKTTMIQYLANALGVQEAVQSPSYTYLHRYASGRLPLAHADLYRADPVDRVTPELLELSQAQTHLLLIEWPERWPDGLGLLDGWFALAPAENNPDEYRSLRYRAINLVL